MSESSDCARETDPLLPSHSSSTPTEGICANLPSHSASTSNVGASDTISTSANDGSSASFLDNSKTLTPLVNTAISVYGLSSTRLATAIGFTWLGSFLAALDSTITSTLSATIASEFGTLTIISWLGSAYLIASTVVQPLSGKLTDIFGRRAGLLVCCALFAAGNTICGFAQSKGVIIVGRVAAGLGGGGLNSICTFVGTDLIPLRRRGVVQGVGMITFSTGIALGGVVGGVVNNAAGWRWAFLVLIPLTLVTAAGVYFSVPGSCTAGKQSIWFRLRRIDFLGSFLLTVALTLLLWALNYEGDLKGSSQTHLAVALPVSAVLLGLFALNEARFAVEPVVPLLLLRNRTVTAACLVSWFESMSLYTLMFYVPLYFQLRGLKTQEVGVRLLPESVGTAIGSLGSGITMRATGDYSVLKFFVLVVMLVGPGGFSLSNLDTPTALTEVYLLFNGLGFGGMLTTMLLCLLSAIDHEMQAIATAVMYAFRSIGATIGVTISGLLFRKMLAAQLADGNLDNQGIHKILDGCHNEGGKDQCARGILDAYMSALHAVFLLALGFGAAGMVSGLFIRNRKLRTNLKSPNDMEG